MRDSPKLFRRARAPFRNLAQAILAAQIDKADAVRLLRRGRRCLPNVAASVSRSTCDLGAASAAEERRIRRRSLGKSPASAPLRASGVDPLLTCNSAETTDKAYLHEFSSPLTDSNRRPPLYPDGIR